MVGFENLVIFVDSAGAWSVTGHINIHDEDLAMMERYTTAIFPTAVSTRMSAFACSYWKKQW